MVRGHYQRALEVFDDIIESEEVRAVSPRSRANTDFADPVYR